MALWRTATGTRRVLYSHPSTTARDTPQGGPRAIAAAHAEPTSPEKSSMTLPVVGCKWCRPDHPEAHGTGHTGIANRYSTVRSPRTHGTVGVQTCHASPGEVSTSSCRSVCDRPVGLGVAESGDSDRLSAALAWEYSPKSISLATPSERRAASLTGNAMPRVSRGGVLPNALASFASLRPSSNESATRAASKSGMCESK